MVLSFSAGVILGFVLGYVRRGCYEAKQWQVFAEEAESMFRESPMRTGGIKTGPVPPRPPLPQRVVRQRIGAIASEVNPRVTVTVAVAE